MSVLQESENASSEQEVEEPRWHQRVKIQSLVNCSVGECTRELRQSRRTDTTDLALSRVHRCIVDWHVRATNPPGEVADGGEASIFLPEKGAKRSAGERFPISTAGSDYTLSDDVEKA